MTQSDQTRRTIPAVIRAKLRGVGRRSLTLRIAQGLLLTATVLLAAMILSIAIDWMVVLFDTRIRIWLTLTSVGAAGFAFVFWVLRPIIARLRLSALARDVDDAVPVLEERWSTVTELAESEDPPEVLGAPRLIQQVSQEAEALSDRVKPRKVLSAKGLRRYSVYFVIAILPLVMAFLLAPAETSVLLQRFLLPTQNITMTRITSLTGSRVVPRGEPLILEARTEGRQRDKADLFLAGPSGEKRVRVARATTFPATFAYKIRSVEESFSYRFRAGDSQTDWHEITALERPDIAGIRFRLSPPAYSKLEGQQGDSLPRRCKTLRGSELELEVMPSKPIDRVELRFKEDDSAVFSERDGEWFRYEDVLAETISFTVSLVDEHGLENLNPPSCRIFVYKDRPPEVEIVSPEERIFVPPDDTIEVKFVASDDLGIASAELVVRKGGFDVPQTEEVFPIPLGANLGAKVVEATIPLELEPFDLKHGDELSYEIRVADTRQEVVSSREQASRIGTSQAADGQEIAAADQTQQEQQGPQTEPSQASDGQQTAATDQTQQRQQEPRTEPGQPPDRQQIAAVDQARQQQDQQGSTSSEPTPGSQQDQQMPAPGKPTASQAQAPSSAPPPSEMRKRLLDVGQCSACSKPHRLQVDKWAGKYEGQAREKLQIAISEYLERLDKALAAAETVTDDLRGHIQQKINWGEVQDKDLERDREHLAEADQTIAELKNKSANTPYAFISLELHEIGFSHVTPAREHLANAVPLEDDDAARLAELDQASLHIHRARKLLADLTREFEAVKKEEKLAEAFDRVAEMHQIFIEDMQALLMSKKPKLNPRTGEMIEVSEEFAKALQERYERLKKLLDELAKVLAEDPELLRRFMAIMRMDADTIRDQLTILALRQEVLHEQLAAWIDTATGERMGVRDEFIKNLLSEQMAIAGAASLLNDNMITWLPAGTALAATGIDGISKLSSGAAITASQIAQKMAAGDTEPALELTEQLTSDLEKLQEQLALAAIREATHEKLGIFAANRTAEALSICSQESEWAEKVKAVSEGDCSRATEIDQYRLALDTVDFGIKLDRFMPWFRRFTPEIRDKAEELEQTVATDILDHELVACMGLQDDELDDARQAQADAVVTFATAEELFDELLTLIEKELPKEPGMCCVPTLEQVLKMLENECKACEKLGLACSRVNVRVEMDWAMPGEGSGSRPGSGSGPATGRGKSQGQPQRTAGRPFRSEAMRRLAEAQARAAQAYARQAMEEMRKASQGSQRAARERIMAMESTPGTDGAPEIALNFREGQDSREWDTLASDLAKEIRQSRQNVPPENYQAAIDAYFRAIAELVAGLPTPP